MICSSQWEKKANEFISLTPTPPSYNNYIHYNIIITTAVHFLFNTNAFSAVPSVSRNTKAIGIKYLMQMTQNYHKFNQYN
jgi:hypothetical protein